MFRSYEEKSSVTEVICAMQQYHLFLTHSDIET